MRWTLAGALLALIAPAAAQAAWQEASSRHFVVYSNDSPDHVRAFTVQLERFDEAMHALRDVPDDHATRAARVTVFVVEGLAEIQQMSSDNVAGFYIPRARGAVAFVPRHGKGGVDEQLTPQNILLHEYAHHWMYANWGGTVFPSWFIEGFAEFNATAVFEKDGSVTIGTAPPYRGYGVDGSQGLSAATLLAAASGRMSSGRMEAVFYARAWLLTHYLMSDPGRREQLDRYIAAINAGARPAEAAKVFGDPAELDRRLDRYVRSPSLHAFAIPAQALAAPEVMVRALSPAESAVMPARIRTERGVLPRNRDEIAAQARKLAAPFPDDAAAQTELAEADFDAGDLAGAEAASLRAIAADPQAKAALLVQGRARTSELVNGKVTDPARWQAARLWLARANRLDPDDPWPLVLYYGSFAAAHERPTPLAQAGLLRAHELAPFDTALSLRVATLYLRENKLAEARAALEPVAYNPHGGGAAERAAAALTQLDAGGEGGGAHAALAALYPPKPAPADKGDDQDMRPSQR